MTRSFPAAAAALAAFAALIVSVVPAQAQSIDETVNQIFADSTGWFVSFIFAPIPGTSIAWIVLWLVLAASVFTVYFGFIQFRVIGHALALVSGKLGRKPVVTPSEPRTNCEPG